MLNATALILAQVNCTNTIVTWLQQEPLPSLFIIHVARSFDKIDSKINRSRLPVQWLACL